MATIKGKTTDQLNSENERLLTHSAAIRAALQGLSESHSGIVSDKLTVERRQATYQLAVGEAVLAVKLDKSWQAGSFKTLKDYILEVSGISTTDKAPSLDETSTGYTYQAINQWAVACSVPLVHQNFVALGSALATTVSQKLRNKKVAESLRATLEQVVASCDGSAASRGKVRTAAAAIKSSRATGEDQPVNLPATVAKTKDRLEAREKTLIALNKEVTVLRAHLVKLQAAATTTTAPAIDPIALTNAARDMFVAAIEAQVIAKVMTREQADKAIAVAFPSMIQIA